MNYYKRSPSRIGNQVSYEVETMFVFQYQQQSSFNNNEYQDLGCTTRQSRLIKLIFR